MTSKKYSQDQKEKDQYDQLIGASEHISKLREEISYVAQKIQKHDLNVLILGESGTGKELIAKAISKKSGRTNFIAVNCAALPGTLFESELFGYKKGAFSGAVNNKPGLIEGAKDGILFLDEIGDLAPEHQGKILRLLQNKTYIPLGDTIEKNISNIRIITATNKNLGKEIKEGTFREDLYYRLNHRVIKTIPLKDRRSDIICLLHHFLKKSKLTIDNKSKALLYSYDFPGNVRELESLLYSADDFQYINDTLLQRVCDLIGKPIESVYDAYEIYKEMRNRANEKPISDKYLQERDLVIAAVTFFDTISEVERNEKDWGCETEKYEILILWGITDYSREKICRILGIRNESLSPDRFMEKFGTELPAREEIQAKLRGVDGLRLCPDFVSNPRLCF